MAKTPLKTKTLGGAWPALANQAAVDFLASNISQGKVAQAYIFTGPPDLGKFSLATSFARNLLASDSTLAAEFLDRPQTNESSDFSALSGDIHILQVEDGKKNISIEQTRAFIKILSFSSFLNSYKIGIIREAEKLSIEAANSLLKTLEESQPKVVIILTVNDLSSLPATLVSRSQILYFYPLSSDLIYDYLVKEEECDRNLARDLANLSAGRPLRALMFFQDSEAYADYLKIAKVFLDSFGQSLNQRLLALADILPKNYGDSDPLSGARSILEIWQSLTRDLLLINLEVKELVQHSVLMSELLSVSASLKQFNDEAARLYLVSLLERIKTAQIYLSSYVSPNNVLENILLNL